MANTDVAGIMRKLNDPDPEVRRATIESLQPDDLNDALVRMLVHKLEDDNKGVRDAAFQVLKVTRHPSLPKLLSPFFYYRDLEIKNIAVDIMVELGEMAVPELIEILDTSDPDAQKSAAEVINIIKSHQAVDALLKHIDDPDPNVGFACIEALGTIGDYKAIQPLIRVFKTNEDLRGVAIEALGKILSRRLPEELMEGLHSDDPIVVYSVIEALGKIKDTTTLEKLIEIFPYQEEILQNEILKAIAEIIAGSKYILLPTHLLEPALAFYEEADLEEKIKYLRLFSRIPSEKALDTLLNAYQLSEDEQWQHQVFESMVNYFLLFPAQVMEQVFAADDPEYRMYLLSHMPYTGLPEYYEFLSSYYQNAESEEEKQTALYYLLQFNLPEVDEKIKNILNNPESEEHVILLEVFKEKEIEPYLEELQTHLIQYPDDLQTAYLQLLAAREIPDLYERFESVESGLSDQARLFLYTTKKQLTEKDFKFLEKFMDPDNESLQTVLEILLNASHEKHPDKLKTLWHAEDWQIQNTLSRLYIHRYHSLLEEFLLSSVQNESLFLTIVAELENEQIPVSGELLDKVSPELNDNQIHSLMSYILGLNDDKMAEWLKKFGETLSSAKLDQFIEYLIAHEQYDKVKKLMTLIEVPKELSEKYSDFINE